MNKEKIMLRIITFIFSVTLFGGVAFAQNAPESEVLTLRFQLAQMTARAVIAERAKIAHTVQLAVRDTAIASQEAENKELNELLDLAMEQIALSDAIIAKEEGILDMQCVQSTSPSPGCAEYKALLLQYPKVYAIWGTSSVM